MLSWSIINDEPHHGEEAATAAIDEGQASRETTEAREARHNAVYEQALALHGEGAPHSDAWARAKKLYDTVISDEPMEDKSSASSFGTPVRFLCLKNLADMVEREGDKARALELQVAAADEDATDVAVWMKMARLSRAAGLSNLARLALERLLEVNGDHVLALRTLKDVLSEIGDVAACREVTKRLLNLDPYAGSGLSSVAAVEHPSPVPFHGPPATTASTRGEQQQQAGHPLPCPRWASPSRSSPPHCVERTLDLPSWERLGRLLIDTRACIVRGQRAAPPAAAAGTSAGAGELVPASASSSSAAVAAGHLLGRESGDSGSGGDVDVPSAAAAAAAAAAVSTAVPQPPLTLSTPVRIVLRLRDEAQAAAAAGADAPAGSASGLEGGEGGDRNGVGATTAAAGNDSHEHSKQEQHNQRRLRRPSVEKAMEWYSDGSSSSDDDDEGGEEEGGKGKGKGKLNGGRQSELRAERRTSARRQKQVEIREADVAAAREDDVEFRVASLFLTAEEASHDDKGDGGLGAAAAADEEGEQQEAERAWWPNLARGAGRGARVDGSAAAEGGGACGDAGELEEEEVALAAKMLPRWKQRHDVDCRRCGEGGIVLCCDFCHLVYHPRCLEVTPGLTSLFACSDCKEEAAILEWELKGRDDAASGAVAGGLQELLRAADGRAGNAGVVDLMLRWLKGVTTAPTDDLCLEAAYCAADNRARGGGRGGGNGGVPQTTAGVPSGGYQLAAVALAVEPIVRGYLPTRFTWPALLAVGPPPATVDAAAPGEDDGPELGLACELALAEMRVDKALSLMRQRQQQQRPAGGSKSNAHSPAGVQPSAPVGGADPPTAAAVTAAAAPAGTAGAAAPPAAAAAAAVVVTDGAATEVGGKKNEGAGGGGGGGCLRRSPEDLAREASDILADADRAMLQLEPWCLAIDNSNLGDDGDGAAGHGESNTAPWVLVVRWWWLKGIRARQGGQAEEALEHFHLCERALRGRGREQRAQQGSGASSGQEEEKGDEFNDEDEEEVAVLLPYCSVHPRIDLQVVRGLITDVELSGTSEAAREAFSSAILLLSKCAAVRNVDTAAGQRATVTAGTGTGATAEAARPGAASQSGAYGKSGGTPGGGSSGGGGGGGGGVDAAVTESRVGDAPDSQSVVSAESNPAGSARLAPGGGQGNGERCFPSAAVDGTAQPGGTGGGVKASSPPQQRDQALKALACVMRGLESRFVARAPLASPPFQGSISAPQSAAAAAVAGGPGAPGVTAEPKSATAAGNRGGWTARVLSSRAEELLSDLLEKEKAFLAQVNRDGARALERLAADLDKPNAAAAAATSAPPPPPPPPFFLARTSPAPATPVITVPAVLASAGGRSDIAAPRLTTAGPSSPPGTSTAAAVSGGERELLFRRRRRHVPLRLSGPGLGDQNSVFSMMLRGASLLDRHEIAVLLAVRCAEHFLDASDVLASPKGPLGIGGGGGGRRGSPAKRRAGAAGRSGSEGLGAVHLLLTSRSPGADRRAVDAAVTSATAEFLAHALAVVVWAVPCAARAELFGDGGGGGDGRREIAAAAAAARRASVLRCLARLMRHSMEDDNTRVLNLCVIAWQAIAAVAHVPNNASTRTDTETGKPLPPEGRSAMGVEAELVQSSHDDEAGGVSTADCGAFAAESVVRGLVRCLCGVVVGRWKQTAKARKKAWVLHAMEAVHALVRTLEYLQSVSCSNAKPYTENTNLTDSDSVIGPRLNPGVSGVAGSDSGVITPSASVGANPARRSSSFFFNAGELREVVKALMGLSNLPDGPTPATAAAAAAAATKGAGGAAGGGGGGGGGAGASPPGGGLGVKLTCSLAVLVVGLSDAASWLDAPRRVGLVETLHAHLKGKPGSAAVTLGGALEGRAGYGGVCADGEGVFLKTALLYLSSQQVASAVRKEEQERQSPGGENRDNDDVGLSRDVGSEDGNEDDDDGVEIDVEGTEDGDDGGGESDGGGGVGGGGGNGRAKDREMERLTSYNGSPKQGDAEPASGGAGGSRGKGRRQPSKRAERLGERVLRALSQCQACLYDVAMAPCEDHRCLTPPSPPSTALEARALYVCWESRLPDLRRSHALRLLEAVAAHAAFSSPPNTRFSKAVETHVFLAWSPLATARADMRAVEKDGQGVQGSSSRSSGGPGSRVLSFLHGTGSALPDGVFDNMPVASGGGNGCSAPAATGTTIAAAAAPKDGTRDVNSDRSGASAVSAGTEREKRDTHEERRGPGTERGDPQSAGRWGGAPVDPEMEAFRRVYLGFYKNLVEAKGVPSGFRSCATKSIGDASDTEAALMQGIRWRVLDLSFCPDRMSSWKGLAQCACRLAALYLDAFSPSCHRLGMPLMATAAPARKPMADSRAAGRGNPPRSPSAPGTKAGGEGAEAIDSSAAESPGSCPAAVAPGDTPSPNADAVMSDVVDAVDGGSSGVPAGSPAPGRKESGGGTGNGSGVGGGSPSNVTPPAPANDATMAIEVAGTRNPEQAGLGGDDIPNLVIDIGDGDTPAVADAAAPIAAGGTFSGSMDVSTGRGRAPSSLATAAAAGCATIAPRSTSMVTDDGRSGSGSGGGGGGGGSGSGVDLLGKRRLSTAYTGLVIDTGDAVLPADGSGARKRGRQGGGGSEKETQRTASPPPFQALGLRGTPGPDLGPFFRGTSLDARAARKDGKGGGRRGGTRLAAIAEGLRRLGASGARTAAESAAAETMATRILGGSATHEEWAACLGHASIAAAVGAAEKAFSAWKALAEEALAKARREALRGGGKGGGGHEGGADGGGLDACETAARDLAECCEEEAFMKFMLARDVWPGAEPASTATASAAGGAASVTAAGPAPTAATAPAARVPAGLEAGGRRRLLESSLSLLQRAQRLRETGGEGGGSSSSARSPSPPSTASSSPRCRRPLSGSPVSSRPRSPKTLAREAFAVGGGGEQQDKSAARKRRKLFEASSSPGGGGGSAAAALPHDSARVRGGGVGKEEKRNREAGKGQEEEEDEDEDDVLRWQVPFVMGRLCSQLGKDPRAVLEKLAEALRLAQGEHVPLEDELEALCRLHSARVELILSGDSTRFAAVASTVEAFPFREDDTDGDDEEGGSADFAPPPAIFSTSPSATPAAGGGGGGAPVGQGAEEEDICARRLSVLENCLDAFESCLDENKGQHTAIFAMANAMYRGVAIADDARLVLSSAEAMSLMVRNSQRGRAYGPQAALQTLKPLFEKRQQLLLAMSASDGVVGPGLALLSSRRRKLQALKRKYYALYIELLRATNNTGTLQGLLRRTKGVRETREEVVWVQRGVLRALLAILRSDIDNRAQKRLHGVAAAAAPSPSRGAGANPPPTLSTRPATAAAGAAAVTGDGNTSATAGPRTGTEAEVLRAVDNPGAAQPQARAMAGAAAAATGVVPGPLGQSKEVAAATPAAAAASGGSNAAKPGGDEKPALENAWNLYVQVVDLESTTRSGGGSSSSLRPGQSSCFGLTLLGDAEEVLVKSWQAFGAANAAVLELVELQNPLPSPGKGAGPDTGGGMLLRRARACCHVFWPDKQGRGKMSKSKLKLKRPAAAAVALPLASSANRAAPRPKVQPRTTPPPASAGAAVVARDAVQQDKSTGGKGGKEARPDVATAGPAATTPTP